MICRKRIYEVLENVILSEMKWSRKISLLFFLDFSISLCFIRNDKSINFQKL